MSHNKILPPNGVVSAITNRG